MLCTKCNVDKRRLTNVSLCKLSSEKNSAHKELLIGP
jgi:hypothetical protein